MSLTRTRVIDTAVEILTRYGLADLSMRRLARELGVQPGALYWHVENKQVLLVEVAARLLERVAQGAVSQEAPDRALVRTAVAVREALVRVPDGADVVALAWAVEPDSVPAITALRGMVEALVGPGELAAVATEVVLHHILGSVAAQQNRALSAAADPKVSPPDEASAVVTFTTGLEVVVRGITAGADHVPAPAVS